MDLHARDLDQTSVPLLRRRLQVSIGKFDALAALFGVCLGASVAVHAWDLEALGVWAWLAVAGCIVLGTLLAHLLLWNLVYPGLQRYSLRMQSAWILICLVAGFGLLETIPITIYPKTQVVRIVATGEKNQVSQGSEVWLNMIHAGPTAIPVHPYACDGEWLPVGRTLFSPHEYQPSVLSCRIRTDQDIDIQFGMHGWSGEAQVIYDHEKVFEDLYVASYDLKDVTLDVRLSASDANLRTFLLLAGGLSLGLCLLAASVFVAGFSVPATTYLPGKKRTWIGYSLVMGGVWLIYLLAFWPGSLSPDSAKQFEQVVTGQLTNWHPAFHTLFLWLVTRIWLSPAPVAFLQMVLFAWVLGWGLGKIQSLGVPLWICWAIALFLAGSPAYGSILLNPWKDIPYTFAVIALTLMILSWSIHAGRDGAPGRAAIDRPVFWVGLGLVAALAALFRQNGGLVAFGTLPLLALADRRRWRWAALALLVSVALYGLVTGPLYAALKVNTRLEAAGQNMGPYASAAYIVRYHQMAGAILEPAETELLEQLFPSDNIISTAVLGSQTKETVQAAFAVSMRNPLTTLRFFQAKSSFIFQILQPKDARLEYWGDALVENPFGIVPDSKIPRLQSILRKVLEISEWPEFDWLLWRNAFWMYLLGAASILAGVRAKNWRLLFVMLPVLLNALPLAPFSGGHISRYIFPTLVIGPLLGIGLLFVQPDPSFAQLDAQRLVRKE